MVSLALDHLPVGAEATVMQVQAQDDAASQHLALRLIEIGFLPGERVRVIARGQPGNEPIAVRVGRSTFALRRHEAGLIGVQPLLQAVTTAEAAA